MGTQSQRSTNITDQVPGTGLSLSKTQLRIHIVLLESREKYVHVFQDFDTILPQNEQQL